jgi:hypothetical protein
MVPHAKESTMQKETTLFLRGDIHRNGDRQKKEIRKSLQLEES